MAAFRAWRTSQAARAVDRSRRIACLALAAGVLPCLRAQSYRVEPINVPQDIRLEVGGMGFWPDGTLVMCTRRGEVWLYKKQRFERFAFGLHEPLGLLAGKDGEIWVLQRSELTHIRDSDGDRKADVFTTLNQDWGYSGNYHEYALGLVRDKAGNFYGNLGLAFMNGGDRFKGRWLGTKDEVKWRGWLIQVTPKGELVPFAPGLRAPNGLGISPDAELFVTDNQGSYVACGWLMHVRKGEFLGHPSALIDDVRLKEPWKLPRSKLDAMRKRPAVYFPHGPMGNSTSQPIWDTTAGKFGPFAGQVFVGEVQNGRLARASLEKVGGEYQGACYPFLFDKLGGGANRLVFDREGTLWIGFTGRGWAAGEGLKKVSYSGHAPCSIHTMSLTRTGFVLRFTKPVDPVSASDVANYSISHFEYEWTPKYGAPPKNKTLVKLKSARVTDGGSTVHLELPALHAKKVYSLDIARTVRARDGAKLENPKAYYTLNKLR